MALKKTNFNINQWSITIREELDHSLDTLNKSLLGLSTEVVSDTGLTRLEVARRQVKRFRDLMENLSILINEREQQYHIAVAEGDFATFLYSMLEPYRSYCIHAGIVLTDEIKQGPTGFFAFERIAKVLETLLVNAVEFCAAKQGKINIALRFDPIHRQWLLSVQDNGIGIREEKLPHIFDPNYAGDDLHMRHFQSVSLGLFLAKTYAESIGGELKVSSITQVYTRFELSWPHADTLESLPFKRRRKVPGPEPTLRAATDTLQHSLFGQLNPTDNGTAEEYIIVLCEDCHDAFVSQLIGNGYRLVYSRDVTTALARCLHFGPIAMFIYEGQYNQIDAKQLVYSLRQNKGHSHMAVLWWGEDAPTGIDQQYNAQRDAQEVREAINNYLLRFKALRKGQMAENRIKLKSKNEQFMDRVNAAIEANLGRSDFGPTDLAQAVFMDRSQLHRKLKKLKSINASGYIRNYRLSRAYEALEAGIMNISEVAQWSGFSSTSYFSSSFCRFFGRRPSDILQQRY